jgi:ATP-binding cassette subfamily B protein
LKGPRSQALTVVSRLGRRTHQAGDPQGVPTDIWRTLRFLGAASLGRQITWIALWSLVSGLSQAALLVLVSQLAVGSVQHDRRISIEGLHLTTDRAIAACFGVLILSFVASLIAAYAGSSMSRRALEAGRSKMIDAFFGASWAVQSEERLGHVQQLLTVNCENIGNVILTIASGLQSVLSVIALLGAAFVVDPLAAGVVLSFGLLLFVVLRPFNKWGRRAAAHLSDASNEMATHVTEYTRLAREFRLFGVERRATSQLHDSNHDAASAFQHSRNLSQVNPVIYQTLALAFVIGGIALLSHHGGNDLASTGAVLLLVLRSLSYGSAIQSISLQLSSFQAFLDRLRADLVRYLDKPEAQGPKRVPNSFGLAFRDVTYSYDGRINALSNVSFELAQGDFLGVLGRSGSGKTTLSQIVLGMRRPAGGAALLGDVAVSDIATTDGGSPVALVAQEPVLLRGSISANIAFFRDIPQATIETAARDAHLHEDITGMPGGYETSVGEGGSAISGGQRQRLAIARALVGAPRLLVLDEPTSALDGRSESLIRQTLGELRGRVTMVVISHRLATIEDCDRLLVLEKGQVADFGPRQEVQAREPYRRVAEAALDDDLVFEHAAEQRPLSEGGSVPANHVAVPTPSGP